MSPVMRLKALQTLYQGAVRACFAVGLSCAVIACGSGGLRWNSQLYRVHAGETLYAIAWRYNLDYRDLAKWNGIASPYTIRPGQQLILSDPALLPESRQPAASPDKKPVATKRRSPAMTSAEAKPALPPPSKWI